MRSSRTTSGSTSSTCSSAALPLAASATVNPSSRSSAASIRRMLASSSTSRIWRPRGHRPRIRTTNVAPPPGVGSTRDGALVHLHRLLGERQAEAGAAALARDVGVEQPAGELGRHAGAVVAGSRSAPRRPRAARTARSAPRPSHASTAFRSDVAERAAQRVVMAEQRAEDRGRARAAPASWAARWCARDRVSSSARSTGAAGPSGRRPNSVNSRASCSSRPDSATSTSIASCWAGRRRCAASCATASRIGVSGLRISCATRRAVSRKARSRSASISRARPCSSAVGHLPQRRAQRLELGRAPPRPVGRQRLDAAGCARSSRSALRWAG